MLGLECEEQSAGSGVWKMHCIERVKLGLHSKIVVKLSKQSILIFFSSHLGTFY